MNYKISVRAGPDGENSDVYRYVNSAIPEGIKSVDDSIYKILTKSLLDTAIEIVRANNKDINLTFLVEEK